MIKELLREIDYTFFAETALVLFLVIFLVVSVMTLLGSHQQSVKHAHIVLDENEVSK